MEIKIEKNKVMPQGNKNDILISPDKEQLCIGITEKCKSERI